LAEMQAQLKHTDEEREKLVMQFRRAVADQNEFEVTAEIVSLGNLKEYDRRRGMVVGFNEELGHFDVSFSIDPPLAPSRLLRT